MVVPEIVSYKSFDGLKFLHFYIVPKIKRRGDPVSTWRLKDQYGFGWDGLAQYFTAKVIPTSRQITRLNRLWTRI